MKITKEASWETCTVYRLCFTDEEGNGFAFPCDSNGKVQECLPPEAVTNLKECLVHPERFARSNWVEARTAEIRTPAEGTCECGKEIRVEEDYLGACQCPYCGRWHNMFGQELLPPGRWGSDAEG